MTIKVEAAQEYMDFALGGKPSAKIGSMRLINIAGQLLYSLADWNWKTREPQTMAFVAGQEYVVLPTDFGEAVAFSVNNDIIQTFDWISHGRLIEMRSNVLADLAGKYFGCIVYPAVADNSTEPAPPRLEIVPTPGANVDDAMRVSYDARWVKVDDADDFIQIPEFVEPLFFEVLGAVALGTHYMREGTMTARMNEVKKGDIFRSVRRTDLNLQPSRGEMEGGQIGSTGRWLAIGKPESVGGPS